MRIEDLPKLKDLKIIEENKDKYPIKKYDDENRLVYCEKTPGKWIKSKYDQRGNHIKKETSEGYFLEYPANKFVFEWKYDENDNVIYREEKIICNDGSIEGKNWTKYEYDKNGNKTFIEFSNGCCVKYKYDEEGNRIYDEYSDGTWCKYYYDEQGKKIFEIDSNGNWEKKEKDKIIRYEDGQYFIDGKKAKLKND